MPAASAGTIVALRLARIAALVAGSLLFLYACEFGDGTGSASWWVEVAFAAGLGIAGLCAGWFQITRAQASADRELRDCSDGHELRVRMSPSGNLVVHARDRRGTYPDYEWTWTFRPATFPAIRTALGGGEGDLVDLLERTIPELDQHGYDDPGAWLREHDIPARYRERGDHPNRITRELPVIELGRWVPSRRAPSQRDRSAPTHRRHSSRPDHGEPRATSRRDLPPPARSGTRPADGPRSAEFDPDSPSRQVPNRSGGRHGWASQR
ncbi:hypothetical protein [Nocardia australiensis]|uniref:hypothetical protein n=1 Tax=Nocardia australiensis TaxID=2887191 RepID=UPI001D14D8CF|nr:hypothetical protein [Nocardia australiensis]